MNTPKDKDYKKRFDTPRTVIVNQTEKELSSSVEAAIAQHFEEISQIQIMEKENANSQQFQLPQEEQQSDPEIPEYLSDSLDISTPLSHVAKDPLLSVIFFFVFCMCNFFSLRTTKLSTRKSLHICRSLHQF